MLTDKQRALLHAAVSRGQSEPPPRQDTQPLLAVPSRDVQEQLAMLEERIRACAKLREEHTGDIAWDDAP